jgi:2-dehydropantoate 2-reductase
MRYIIYGAGAIGGVTGGRLFQHGHEVVLIARGAHLKALQRDGLMLRSPQGDDRLPIPTVGNPSEIDFREGDVILLAMKSQDTIGALADLEAARGIDLPVFCAQNGVENERLAFRFGASRVYAMHVTMSALYLEDGVVEAQSAPIAGLLDAGVYPEGVDSLVEAVCADIEASGMASMPRADIMRWKYTKLLLNLGNGLDAACGLGIDSRELRATLWAEGEAVLDAAGIDHISAEELNQRRNEVIKIQGKRNGSSGWQSVARGAGSVEVDYLNGEIVMLGRLHGVPTPLNEAVRRLANRVARERAEPGSVTPEEVRRLADALSKEGARA